LHSRDSVCVYIGGGRDEAGKCTAFDHRFTRIDRSSVIDRLPLTFGIEYLRVLYGSVFSVLK